MTSDLGLKRPFKEATSSSYPNHHLLHVLGLLVTTINKPQSPSAWPCHHSVHTLSPSVKCTWPRHHSTQTMITISHMYLVTTLNTPPSHVPGLITTLNTPSITCTWSYHHCTHNLSLVATQGQWWSVEQVLCVKCALFGVLKIFSLWCDESTISCRVSIVTTKGL